MTSNPATQRDLRALRRLINQADLVLATIPDPYPSIASARESLSGLLALAGIADHVWSIAQLLA